MTADDVLTIAPAVSARLQRESYFRAGDLAVERPGTDRERPGPNALPARVVHLDPTPCPVAPDWGKIGRGSIFAAQRTGEAI